MKTDNMSVPGWDLLIIAIEHPVLVAGHEGLDLRTLMEDLNANGLLPLAYHRWRAAGVLESFPAEFLSELERKMVHYRAAWAAIWQEIDAALEEFVQAGLHPIVLKGAHLALQYYEAPHLRPLSDLDVAFPTLDEAGVAYKLLSNKGFHFGGESIGGDDWTRSHHMPALERSQTGFHLEVHGSLVYAPKDRRWISGARRLLDARGSFEHNGLVAEGLSPEANVVYLCAHMFLQHSPDQVKAVVLYDLKAVLETAGDRFSWDRVRELSGAGGFDAAVGRGLRLLHSLLGYPIPAHILKGLKKEADNTMPLSPEAHRTGKVLGQMLHAKKIQEAVGLAVHAVCPPPRYMRYRYPDKSDKNFVYLYLYRWSLQTGKVWRFAAEKLRRKPTL